MTEVRHNLQLKPYFRFSAEPPRKDRH